MNGDDDIVGHADSVERVGAATEAAKEAGNNGAGAGNPLGAPPPQEVDPRSLEDDGRNIAAVADILRNLPIWRGVLAYDRFSMLVMLMKPLPRTGPQTSAAQWTPRPMRDVDTTNALMWFHSIGLKKLGLNMLHNAMVAVAQDNAFHPVLDYFDRICAAPEPAEVPSANEHLIDPALLPEPALSLWLPGVFR